MSEETNTKIYKFAKEIIDKNSSPSHDWQHTMRVYALAMRIADDLIRQGEDVDIDVLKGSVLLHDIGRRDNFNLKGNLNFGDNFDLREIKVFKSCEKDHALISSEIADAFFKEENINLPADKKSKILNAVKFHSRKNTHRADTIELKILQDADKLDATGAVGVMRCFAKGGRELYNPDDPFFEKERKLDDKTFCLDHFFRKLLLLPSLMHTEPAKKIAQQRLRFMENFLNNLKEELIY